MQATEILKEEHRIIESVLSSMETMVATRFVSESIDAEVAADALAAAQFLRTYADRYHHAKEEDHLFRFMEQNHGFLHDQGPIGVMLSEHVQGREHVSAMIEIGEAMTKGLITPEGIHQYTIHAASFIDLLRNHIQKEDNILYPMADQRFSEKEQQDLLPLFAKITVPEGALATAERLAQKYEPQESDCSSGCFACPHCG